MTQTSMGTQNKNNFSYRYSKSKQEDSFWKKDNGCSKFIMTRKFMFLRYRIKRRI